MFHSTFPNGYVSVVLLEGFSHLSLGSIVEPLSRLERSRPEIAPKLVVTGLDSTRVRSQSGIDVGCDECSDALLARLKRGLTPARIVICGPTDKIPVETPQLTRLTRIARRNAVSIYAIGAVAWHLAERGIVASGKAAVHWSTHAAFSEKFKGLETADVLYASSHGATSCAGETATLDMVLSIVSSISPAAARDIADHLLVAYPRPDKTIQPGSRSCRLRGVPSCLSGAVNCMSENIETPISIGRIAWKSNVSSRTLERMFKKYLGQSPQRYYSNLRLEIAHDLLTQTDIALLDVALASGFSAKAVLSKHYKRRYGETPSQMRAMRLSSRQMSNASRHAHRSVFLHKPLRSND